MTQDNSSPGAVQPWRLEIAADTARYLDSFPVQLVPSQIREQLGRLRYGRAEIDWVLRQPWLIARIRQHRLNIDPKDHIQINQRRKDKRALQAWTDRIRDAVACPRCEAAAGDYCQARNGKPMVSIHPRRRKLYLLSPSELAPPDEQAAARSSIVRRGLGEVCPKRSAGPTKT